MTTDLRDFWQGFQSGVEVAVHGNEPDRLLGVRDGFLRFFHDGLDRPAPVAVVPQPLPEQGGHDGLAMSDEEAIERARGHAQRLLERLQGHYHFYACCEGAIHSLEVAASPRYFVRTWTILIGATGEACGGSGSVELPARLVAGLTGEQIGMAIPGTRRSGGMINSLTGGLETRRSATSVATLHALSTLFYGVLESRPVRRR
ncbi:MAG: DUF84 family protein [Acidobacteriota bacterium]